jgi:hypothetical protein
MGDRGSIPDTRGYILFSSLPPRLDRLFRDPPSLLSNGYRGALPRVKNERVVKLNAEVKNMWSYTSIPTYVFMTWYTVKHSDDFNFVP